MYEAILDHELDDDSHVADVASEFDAKEIDDPVDTDGDDDLSLELGADLKETDVDGEIGKCVADFQLNHGVGVPTAIRPGLPQPGLPPGQWQTRPRSGAPRLPRHRACSSTRRWRSTACAFRPECSKQR